MGRIVGIDLGTTNSVVAIVDAGRPKVLENRDAKSLTRSVVSLRRRRAKDGRDGEEMLVGDAAMDNWPLAPRDTILSVKRLMGRAFTDTEVQKARHWAEFEIVEPADGTKDSVSVVIGGKEYSPVEVSAAILRKLKEDAEFRLGQRVTHAVITVPAYFSQIQRAATRKAGMMAGLRVIKILEEPTAAAIAFGIDMESGSEPKNLLVYDMGGGTFDITVLMWAGGVFVQLDLEGDMWLGGDDFDRLLVEHTLRYIRQSHRLDPGKDHAFMATLKQAAQRVKERLSAVETADIVVANMLRDAAGQVVNVEMEVSRTEFEAMIRPLVQKTVALTEKAIRKAELKPEQIDYVLMVGNSTGVRLIQETMEKVFGADRIRRTVHPKHCVAIGAAILAKCLGGMVCQAPGAAEDDAECGHINQLDATVCEKCGAPLVADAEAAQPTATTRRLEAVSPPLGIAPFAYGTQTAGDVFNVFVRKGDPYPTVHPQPQTFYTLHPNQRMISIPVYGGDNLETASANEKQGEAFAVLSANLPKGAAVRVTLWLDDDGCFKVAAQLDDATDLDPWITEGREDAKAVEAIQRLEEKLAAREGQLTGEEAREVAAARKGAFDKMKLRDFKAALLLAEEAIRLVDRAGRHVESETLEDRATRLADYAEFIVQEYAWALDSNYLVELSRLAEQTRMAQRTKEAAQLQQRVEELDKLTDSVPHRVRLILGVKGAILDRIRPADPAMARGFMNEVEGIEQALRSGDQEAEGRFDDTAIRVYEALQKAESAAMETLACGACGEPLEGQRYCPRCKVDQLGLVNKARGVRGATTTQ